MSQTPDAAPIRAVIVDDTDDIRDLLRIVLRRAGYDVVAEAADGRAGIEVVREHRPDLVLLDLAMPVLDGLEALPTLRDLVPDATILVLSGFGAEQMAERALAAGADGYVEKGQPLAALLGVIRELTDARGGG